MTKQALFFELIGGIGVLLIVAAVFMGGVAHATDHNTGPTCIDGGVTGGTTCGAAACRDEDTGGCTPSGGGCGGQFCDLVTASCTCGTAGGIGALKCVCD